MPDKMGYKFLGKKLNMIREYVESGKKEDALKALDVCIDYIEGYDDGDMRNSSGEKDSGMMSEVKKVLMKKK